MTNMSAQSADEPWVPARYGRYILLDRLGKGGMAEVFRALVVGPEQFQSVVVVKRILPHLCANTAFVRMFIDEARLCGRLSHPNIIRVHDFGQQDGQHFIAMEYLQGRNLTAVIRRLVERREFIVPAMAAEIIRQACRGLAYAHELGAADGKPLGIIHRDVSPGNVMVAHSGAVKVLDFGVARVENRFRRSMTDPGHVKGKAAYLAPEQLSSAPFDHRADIFATGILLHELLTGRRLFKGVTSVDSMELVKTMLIPPPSSVNAKVPPRLDEIVLQALARAPGERFQSATAMADALEEFVLEARFSSQELPSFMSRLFGEEMQRERIDISPEDLQALMGRELSEKIITHLVQGERDGTTAAPASPGEGSAGVPATAGTGEVQPEAPEAAPLLAQWPELASGEQGQSDRGAAPPRGRGRKLAAGLATFAVAALGILILRGGSTPPPAPPRVAAGLAAPAAQVKPAPTTGAFERAPAPVPAAIPTTRDQAPAPAATVQISISSTPPRAAVYRAGVKASLGLTPLVITAARGTELVTFRVSKPGYVEGVLEVVPDADKPALVTLARSAAGRPARNDQKVRNALPSDPFAN